MKQLHPKAVWLLMVQYFYMSLYVVFIPFYFIVAIFENYEFLAKIWSFKILIPVLIIVLYFLPLYLWSKLAYRYYKYELTEYGIKKEHGVIWKKYVTIPYDRIQNVDILRGILARLLGLSDLHIQTAGMSGMSQRWGASRSEGRLPGLSIEVADQLRDELIRRAQSSKTQGL